MCCRFVNPNNRTPMFCFTDKFRKLERPDALIHRRGTGSPVKLARRFRVRACSLHNYVNVLRYLYGWIEFRTYRCIYYYAQPFRPFGHREEGTSPPPIFHRLSNFFGHCKNVAVREHIITNIGLDIYSRLKLNDKSN